MRLALGIRDSERKMRQPLAKAEQTHVFQLGQRLTEDADQGQVVSNDLELATLQEEFAFPDCIIDA